MATNGLEIPEADHSVAVMKTAIEIEKFGIQFYTDFSECVRDKRGAALLRSLGNDEKEHQAILEKEIERLSVHCDVNSVKPLNEYLDILPSMVFKAPPGSCLTLQDEIKVLEKGIEVEIASIDMYTSALSRVSDERSRRTLKELAKWETKHRELLEDSLRNLKLEGTWYAYSPILEG